MRAPTAALIVSLADEPEDLARFIVHYQHVDGMGWDGGNLQAVRQSTNLRRSAQDGLADPPPSRPTHAGGGRRSGRLRRMAARVANLLITEHGDGYKSLCRDDAMR
jgi:hypothetical protein